MANFISEDQIEQALLQRLQHECGFDVLDCHTENADELNDGSGRADKRGVILHDRLKAAAMRLNPGIPAAVLDEALERLTDPRRAMNPVAANREFDKLLRDGIPVEFEDAAGKLVQERVTSWQINGVSKRNGEIVDYYNVFRSMKQALKDYAQGQGDQDEPPVREKEALFGLLDDAIAQGLAFCTERGVPLGDVLANEDVFAKLGRFNLFADTLIANDEWRKAFNVYQNTISALYEACKPEVLSRGKSRTVAAFDYLRGVMDGIVGDADIDAASQRIAELLDESVVVNDAEAFTARQYSAEYQIIQKGKTWDLSRIDFDKLRDEFKEATFKNIEIADLRAFIEQKLKLMLEQNATRSDFALRLQKIIDAYNAGGSSTENYYEDLLKFTAEMQSEDERHVREGLSEDELELFDLLNKDGLTRDETQKVKLAAKSLLHRLLEEHPKVLIQDWYRNSQSSKIVRATVEQVLDANLPESYDRAIFKSTCDNVFELIVDHASHGRKWAA